MQNLLIFGEPLVMRSKHRERGCGFQAVIVSNRQKKLGRSNELLRTLAPFARSGVQFDKPRTEPRSKPLGRVSGGSRDEDVESTARNPYWSISSRVNGSGSST